MAVQKGGGKKEGREREGWRRATKLRESVTYFIVIETKKEGKEKGNSGEECAAKPATSLVAERPRFKNGRRGKRGGGGESSLRKIPKADTHQTLSFLRFFLPRWKRREGKGEEKGGKGDHSKGKDRSRKTSGSRSVYFSDCSPWAEKKGGRKGEGEGERKAEEGPLNRRERDILHINRLLPLSNLLWSLTPGNDLAAERGGREEKREKRRGKRGKWSPDSGGKIEEAVGTQRPSHVCSLLRYQLR